MLALLFLIAAEWIGLSVFWKDQGPRHSEAMLEAELERLDRFQTSVIVDAPTRFARNAAAMFQEYLYRKTGSRLASHGSPTVQSVPENFANIPPQPTG